MRKSTSLCLGLSALLGVFSVLPSAAGPNPSSTRPTFSKDVVPILQSKCQDCHRDGGSAPMPLATYAEVRPWAKSIREKVITREMPPWQADPHYGVFSNDRSLSREQIDTIVSWVDSGTLKGDDKDLPPARKQSGGPWTVIRPDVVFTMPEEFDVPADGVVPYKHFPVPTNFKEDVWVQAAEAVPGNSSVVHHIVIFVVEPGEKLRLGPEQDNAILVGQAPGEIPSVYPEGLAKKIKAGSTLVFQMHYTPNGIAGKDRSSVGLALARKPPKREVRTKGISNWRFQIPAGDANYRVESQHTFKEDAHILSFMPHMHLRGKDFLYRAVYPDGRTEILLSVPSYNFNWQTYYHFKEPRRMPAGTRIECVAHYDNSTGNKLNPDPTRVVRPGEQTWEEMMIGWMDYVLDASPAPTTSTAANVK